MAIPQQKTSTPIPGEQPREALTGFSPTPETPAVEIPSTQPTEAEPAREYEPTREEAAERPPAPPQTEDDTGAVQRVMQSVRKKKPTAIPQVRDEMTIEVEYILSAGLEDAYRALSPVEKQEFKMKGEQTALAIRDLLRGSKVKVKNIFRLIIEWLKLLPGVNRFFLEQEAKIKADKIVAVKKKYLS